MLGATGEFPHFSIEDRQRLAETIIAGTRLPVMVNVSHSSLDGALELAQAAKQAGAAALLLMPPYFYRYGEPETGEFLRRFAAAAPAGIPRFLYNIPFFTSPIPIELALDLLRSQAYAGIKDSSGDWQSMSRLLEVRETATIVVGNDSIFTRARSDGAHGSISGVACALPELVGALDAAICSGDTARQQTLDARLHEFIAWIDTMPVPVGIRLALAARGAAPGEHPVPFSRETAARAAAFRAWFSSWWPAVQLEIDQH